MSILLSPLHSTCRPIAISGSDVVLRKDARPMAFADLLCLQEADQGSPPEPLLFEERETDICVLEISGVNLGEEYERCTLRDVYAQWGEEEALPYFRAKALVEWLRANRFCSRCGSKLEPASGETSLLCSRCGNVIYPRISPCIIVLVRRGNQVLLARHLNHTRQYYSCIAGFIEPGESAEHAVRREVMEETGLRIRGIRYVGSQSWPFPSQMMFGFTAEYDGGEIRIQENELKDAAWFSSDALPQTPPPGSLAYRLIHESTKKVAE